MPDPRSTTPGNPIESRKRTPSQKSGSEEPPDPESLLAEGSMAEAVYNSVGGDVRHHGFEVDLTESYAEILESAERAVKSAEALYQRDFLNRKEVEQIKDHVRTTLRTKLGIDLYEYEGDEREPTGPPFDDPSSSW